MTDTLKKKRPLSPHLQIYKPQLTSMTSILHRATGFALFVGCFVLTWWLVALSSNGAAFNEFHEFASSWFGKLLMVGWSFALIYHLLNGIRHLIWDMGKNLDIKSATRTGWLVIVGSVVVTAFIWAKGLGVL